MKFGTCHRRGGVKKRDRKRRKTVVVKKRSGARPKLVGDKMPLSKVQARLALTTDVAAKQGAARLGAQALGWRADDWTSNHIAVQFSGPHRDLIVVQQSHSVASVAPPTSNLRNITAGLNFAAEKMPL